MPYHFTELGLIIFAVTMTAIFLGWFRQLPIIGYVLAGILVGPAVFGLIHGEEQIRFIAEMGVVLLLFILGMELPLQSFRQSYKSALPVTLGMILLSLAVTFGIGLVIPLSLSEKIVYGFIISLSSTAVAVKLLESNKLKSTGTGQIALSVLIAQDLIFVPMLMITNALGGEGMTLLFVVKFFGALVALAALIAYLSRREKVHLIFHSVVERYQDLIPVAALAWCFVGAGLAELMGFSPAYGAFLAGLVIGNSHSKEIILPKIEPIQNVLIMVFFLSIGLLIDLTVIGNNWGLILLLLLGTMIFKTLLCIGLLKIFLPADRWKCSFVTGLTISQIGEFSFILAATALGQGIFSEENYKIILAVIALSIALSPIWSVLLHRFVDVAYRRGAAQALGQALAQVFSRQA